MTRGYEVSAYWLIFLHSKQVYSKPVQVGPM